MSPKKIVELINTVLDDFPDILVATLFGSAVKKRLTPESDIDIGLAAEHSLSYQTRIDLYVAFSKYIPYEIDIIDLQSVSGTILQQALCSGIVVKKSPPLFATLLKKMWFNQADMMPYSHMILRKHCQKFVYG